MYWYRIHFKGREEPEVFKGKLVENVGRIVRLESEEGADLIYDAEDVLFLWRKEVTDV